MLEVTLKKITADNWREAMALSVHEEQQAFVAAVTPPVAIALAKAYVRPDGREVEPYGIYQQDKMVGFLNLHYTPGSPDDYWLFHFFIDKRFQRMGFGAAALDGLMKHIKKTHPSCKRIRLTVHPENHAGIRFYLSLGFTDDQMLTYGEPTYSICL